MITFLKRLFPTLFVHKPAEPHERSQPSERQIDKTLQDSFPASDPPGNY